MRDQKQLDKSLSAKGHRYALIVARFNRHIGQRLLEGALTGLKEQGVKSEDVKIVWVPGAFELPLIAKKLAESHHFDAVICLGAVIRGETAHFDYVASGAAEGILQVSLSTQIPVIFSLLTTDTMDQALERSQSQESNHGFRGALSAIEMVHIIKNLD